MKTDKIKVMFALVVVMWVVYFLEQIFSVHLNAYGIIPRTSRGLIGIVIAPFLHGSFFHLIGNTLPFLVLGIILVSAYEKLAFRVLV